ncbi:MAG: 3'-5' exonuclease, partial [Candidatus Aenigmatarchaeota archaeon]
MTKLCVLDVDYFVEENVPVVRIWGNTKTGKRVLVEDRRFRPYFYVESKKAEKEDIEKMMSDIQNIMFESSSVEKIETIEKEFLGQMKQLIKITLTNPSDISSFRDEVKQLDNVKHKYETDISFHK